MNKILKQFHKQATTDILGVPVLDANLFGQLIVEDIAKYAEKLIEDEWFDVGNAIRDRYEES
jgi:hypothetical protein